jgi:hypothetical protein
LVDYRNALATYCIKGEYDFVVDKCEPNRLTVYYAYMRCRWRMHVSPIFFIHFFNNIGGTYGSKN